MMIPQIESQKQDSEEVKILNKDDFVYPHGCDSAKVICVIETKSARGSGKTPGQISRTVREYWSLDGVKLAEYDPIREEKQII